MVALGPNYPQPFGKYLLIRPIGRGGMAEVFLAREKGYCGELVVKRLLPELSREPHFLQMLVGEAKVASLLHHSAIVRVHELGKEEGQLYLAMEYVPGWDLASLAKAAGGKVPPAIAARVAMAVAEALSHAHASTDLVGAPLGLVHRDVTPSNMLVTPRGAVKLIDFGVARAATQLSMTQPGVVKGKVRFLSPEQIDQKPLDGRSDLFSLGVSLYEVTTGARAFARPQLVDIFKAILREQPPPPSEVVPGYPASLEAVLRRTMEKDRDRRYPDGKALAAALREALRSIPGPTDVGAYVRSLASAHPDILPPVEPSSEPATQPTEVRPGEEGGERPKQGDGRPRRELTFVNMGDAVGEKPLETVTYARSVGQNAQARPVPGRAKGPVETVTYAGAAPSRAEGPVEGGARPAEEPVPLVRRKRGGLDAMLPPLDASSEPAWAASLPGTRPAPHQGSSRRRPGRRRSSTLPLALLLALLTAVAALGTWLILDQIVH